MKHLAAAVALAGFAGSMPLATQAQTIPPQPMAGTRLDVTVRGEIRRVPDIAVVSAGVMTQAVDAATSMRENATRMERVINALKKGGVADRDMSTASLVLSPQYRYVENQAPVISGYQASNNLTIRFRDVGRSGAILDTLVKEGANQISGPNLALDKPGAAQDEARLDAVSKARVRADLYAKASGLRVKRIVSISELENFAGVPVPMLTMARDATTQAKSEILPGEQAIGITVSAVFELE